MKGLVKGYTPDDAYLTVTVGDPVNASETPNTKDVTGVKATFKVADDDRVYTNSTTYTDLDGNGIPDVIEHPENPYKDSDKVLDVSVASETIKKGAGNKALY